MKYMYILVIFISGCGIGSDNRVNNKKCYRDFDLFSFTGIDSIKCDEDNYPYVEVTQNPKTQKIDTLKFYPRINLSKTILPINYMDEYIYAIDKLPSEKYGNYECDIYQYIFFLKDSIYKLHYCNDPEGDSIGVSLNLIEIFTRNQKQSIFLDSNYISPEEFRSIDLKSKLAYQYFFTKISVLGNDQYKLTTIDSSQHIFYYENNKWDTRYEAYTFLKGKYSYNWYVLYGSGIFEKAW